MNTLLLDCFSSVYFDRLVGHVWILLDNFNSFRFLMWSSMRLRKYFFVLPLILSVWMVFGGLLLRPCVPQDCLVWGVKVTSWTVSSSIWKGRQSLDLYILLYNEKLSDQLPAAKSVIFPRTDDRGMPGCSVLYHLWWTSMSRPQTWAKELFQQ